jgi:hypothetical protein
VKTDSLIAHLADGLTPAPRAHVAWVLAGALFCGALLSATLLLLGFGLRPDIGNAMAGGPFWMKFAYTLALTAGGLWIVARLARPGGTAGRQIALLLVPFALLAILAVLEWRAPGADRHHLLMGGSARLCVRNIVIVTLPIFAALFWGLQKLAPTRLTLTGACAGFLAGALGAWIYAFHCNESGAPFVLVWYTLAIMGAGAVGALLGRRLLRW